MIFDEFDEIHCAFLKGGEKIRLLKPLIARPIINGEQVEIVVKKGFVSDGDSTQYAKFMFPKFNKALKAAILHDYMYGKALFTRKIADDIYLQANTELNVSFWRRYVKYFAVRLFGSGNYR
jgi:hypothetical protein